MNGLGERVVKSPETRSDVRMAGGDATLPSFSSADRVTQVSIGPEDAGQRLDNYLFRRAKGVPKSHVYRIVRNGQVRVNAKDFNRKMHDVLSSAKMNVACVHRGDYLSNWFERVGEGVIETHVQSGASATHIFVFDKNVMR